MKNQKGLSLIEVVAALAIVSLVSIMVCTFILTSTRQYQAAGRETDLQYEAQTAGNQVQDFVINAAAGLSYQVDGNKVKSDAQCPNGGSTAANKELYAYRKENTSCIAEKIRWNAAEGKLYYSSYICTKQPGGSYRYDLAEPESLLAEYIVGFSVNLSQAASQNQVSVSLKLEKEGKTYEAGKDIALRNQVKINAGEAELFDVTP